jgi:hypothetical protein
MAMVELGYLQSGSADCESGRSDWEGGRGSGSAVLPSQKVRPSEAWHTMDAHAFAQLCLVEGRR